MVTKTGKFENIGESSLTFDMNLGSYISLENELSKNIPSFYKKKFENTDYLWRGEE